MTDNLSKPLKIMVVAGEASGDLYGAHLAKELKEINPEISLVGLGGSKMKEMGVEIFFDPTPLSVVGLSGILKNFPVFISLLSKVKSYLGQVKPDALILIDSPEFNMRLLDFASKLKIPTFYYFSPTVWAWRANRAKRIAGSKTKILSIFPFEKEAYRKAGCDVIFVGHPMLDIVKTSLSKKEACQRFGLDPQKPVIGLLPGSRKKEVSNLLPTMVKAAKLIKSSFPDAQFLLPLASTLSRDDLEPYYSFLPSPSFLIEEEKYEGLKVCDLAIIASGTATLEAAILGVPMIIIYKVNWIEEAVAKRVLKTKFIGLPNIVAGRRIVVELLQERANPLAISKVALSWLNKKESLERIKLELSKVREKLGEEGAVRRAARAVIRYASP
ncbi:lipid-A-disaccharide synthase [bacterium]|nr:lipid-A-disaccharide synthase [bacterium]